MSNIVNGMKNEMLGSSKVVTVSFVDRAGQELWKQDYTQGSIDEARKIPKGNRVPFVNKAEWRLGEISDDGKTWIIDVVH